MSGVNGFRSIDASDYALGEDADAPSGGTEAPPAAESVIQRGGPPVMAQVVASLDDGALRAQLMETGLSGSDATQEAAKIEKTAEEVEELQAELADLQEIETIYEDMLSDPELDPWMASWIESDLWDLRFDIYDIEDQLGQLEGELEDMLSTAWDGLLGAIQGGLEVLKLETRQVDDRGTDVERRASFMRRERDVKQVNEQAREDLMLQLREKGVVIPIPPRSEVGRRITADLEKKLSVAKETRSEESLAELREVRRQLSSLS